MARKLGAARCMERAAHQLQVVVRPRLCHTIAMPAMRIGWQVGVWRRRLGAAITEARVARLLLVVAHRKVIVSAARSAEDAGASAIFRRPLCSCGIFKVR